MDRLRRTLVIVGLAAVLLVGAATASRPCGRAVIDDWYDNGRIDRPWSCDCLLDGLALQPEVSRPAHLSMRGELERQLRARCAGWPVPVTGPESTVIGSELAGVSEPTSRAAAEPFAVDGDTGDIYSVPWETVVAGIVSGGLVVLIGAAAVRRWRLRA